MSTFSVDKSLRAKSLIEYFNKLPQKQKQVVRKTLYDVGKLISKGSRDEINTLPKHGRKYITYFGVSGTLKKPRYYTASAPGEAPAVVTGRLRNSIDFVVKGNVEMEVGVLKEGSSTAQKRGASYARDLEYKDIINMTGQVKASVAPRPFLSSAYKKNKENIRRMFENALKEAFKIK